MRKNVSSYLEMFYKEQNFDLKNDSDVLLNSGKLIFRGQSKYFWNVISSAGRRLSNKDGKIPQNEFIHYHTNLIENARKFGYDGHDFNSKHNDLEILANIQHLGGATCLTDFSLNFLIALWMACEEGEISQKDINDFNLKNVEANSKADGKVIWIDLGHDINFNSISYYNKYKEGDTIQRLLKKRASKFDLKEHVFPRFWLWEPSMLNNRIIMQDSIFLFGLTAFPKKKKDKKARIYYNEIIIRAEDKKNLRAELELIFGISAETVYFDMPGYANNANSAEKPISEKLLSSRRCLDEAKENFKKEQYIIGLNHINEALKCLYNGECKRNKGSKCDNSKGQLLFWKGEILDGLNNTDEALLNYFEASNSFSNELLNQNNLKNFNYQCESYRKQSIIHYQKMDYESAFNADNNLFCLYNDKGRSSNKNGIDGLFGLIELSIFSFNFDSYIKYLGEAEKIDGLSILGKILHLFLKCLGNIVFRMDSDLIQMLSQFDRLNISNEEPKLVGYFHWEYIDTLKWIETLHEKRNLNYSVKSDEAQKEERKVEYVIKNANLINILVQKAKESQENWLDKTFASKDAVRIDSE